MKREDQLRAVFELLRRRQRVHGVFTLEELAAAGGWKPSTARTYVSKKLRPFLDQVGENAFYIFSLQFPDTYEEFLSLMSQVGSRVTSGLELSPETIATLFSLNPWWQGGSVKGLPKTRRFIVGQIRRKLDLGLAPHCGPPRFTADRKNHCLVPNHLRSPCRGSAPEAYFPGGIR